MIVRAAILGVSLAFGAMAEEARRLRGVVVDESGAPVAEASIYHTGSRFHLMTAAPVVVVRTLDFESFAIRLPQEEPLRVVLKKPVPRPFRECSFHTIVFRHGGPGALRFRKMAGVDARPFVRDDDYVARDYQVKTPSGAARVRHGAGALWSTGAPSDQQVWDSPGYRESRYRAGGLPVDNYRGRTKDATAAAVLDRLLDSACVDVSRLPH